MYVPRSPSYRPLSPAPLPSTILPILRPPPAPRPPYGAPIIHLFSDDEFSDTETLGSQDTESTVEDIPLKRRRVEESSLVEQIFPCSICFELFSIGEFQNCRFCGKTVCYTCIVHTRYVSKLEGLCALCRQTFGDGLPEEEETEDTESEYQPSVASDDLED